MIRDGIRRGLGIACAVLISGLAGVSYGQNAPIPSVGSAAGFFQVSDGVQEGTSATVGDQAGAEPVAQAPATRIDPFWKDIPVTYRLGKPGNYGVPSKGPGYFSARDAWCGHCRDTPPPYPYPPFALMPLSFFDVNWKFLDDPQKSWGCTDGLKRQPAGCNWLVTTGGSVWWRYMSEGNSRLLGVDQDYHLVRTRAYVDLSYLDRGRLYFEFIDAQHLGGVLPPLRLDENRADILNAFADWQFMTVCERPWWVRVGRQELAFGSQRLVTALEWANTRRTFDGVRLFNRGADSDLDIWWTQPVIPDRSNWDRVDGNQHFAGAWLTKRPNDNQTCDAYYLYAGNTDPAPQLQQQVPEYHVHTLGTRSVGNVGNCHHDYEFMFQFGRRGAQDIVAGAATLGHGYHFSWFPTSPQLWLYYDWASGDDNPGVGKHHTFNQLFPFGHYYLGFADVVGRQNIHDLNVHWIMNPAPWVTFIAQYHHLALSASRDALYNPAGNAARQDLTGGAGRHVGDEIDLLWNFHMGPHSDVMVGYSRLFAGRYLRETGAGDDPNLFYLQYGIRW